MVVKNKVKAVILSDFYRGKQIRIPSEYPQFKENVYKYEGKNKIDQHIYLYSGSTVAKGDTN